MICPSVSKSKLSHGGVAGVLRPPVHKTGPNLIGNFATKCNLALKYARRERPTPFSGLLPEVFQEENHD
jgi:hypothetical protein